MQTRCFLELFIDPRSDAGIIGIYNSSCFATEMHEEEIAQTFALRYAHIIKIVLFSLMAVDAMNVQRTLSFKPWSDTLLRAFKNK